MCWEPDTYLGNDFMQSLTANWQHAWPHGTKDTFERSSTTRMLQFTPCFRTRTREMRFWTVRSDFFAAYPEMSEDIPRLEETPLVHRPSASGGANISADVERRRQDQSEIDSARLRMRTSYLQILQLLQANTDWSPGHRR